MSEKASCRGEAAENIAQVKASAAAAFFDLDGTLMDKPSLERRLRKALHDAGEIPLRNYAAWIGEVIRELTRGRVAAVQANKKYLRGVATARSADGAQLRREATAVPIRALRFFPEGVKRAAWHARQGHAIVLVTGTLQPLAVRAAAALRKALKTQGCETAVHVCATRLEEKNGRWTGRVCGEAMFGEAKALAVRMLAREFALDLAQCSAYGDSEQDRWMLGCVGHPFAVNASRGLQGIARARGWPALRWTSADAQLRNDGAADGVRLCDGDAA